MKLSRKLFVIGFLLLTVVMASIAIVISIRLQQSDTTQEDVSAAVPNCSCTVAGDIIENKCGGENVPFCNYVNSNNTCQCMTFRPSVACSCVGGNVTSQCDDDAYFAICYPNADTCSCALRPTIAIQVTIAPTETDPTPTIAATEIVTVVPTDQIKFKEISGKVYCQDDGSTTKYNIEGAKIYVSDYLGRNYQLITDSEGGYKVSIPLPYGILGGEQYESIIDSILNGFSDPNAQISATGQKYSNMTPLPKSDNFAENCNNTSITGCTKILDQPLCGNTSIGGSTSYIKCGVNQNSTIQKLDFRFKNCSTVSNVTATQTQNSPTPTNEATLTPTQSIVTETPTQPVNNPTNTTVPNTSVPNNTITPTRVVNPTSNNPTSVPANTTAPNATSVVASTSDFEVSFIRKADCTNEMNVANISVTIKIKNKANSALNIGAINLFDTNLIQDYLNKSSITFAGVYQANNNSINWSADSLPDIPSGATMNLSYKLRLPNTAFGVYTHRVEIYKGNTPALQVNDSAYYNCLTNTAIFSDKVDRMILAVLLIVMGTLFFMWSFDKKIGDKIWFTLLPIIYRSTGIFEKEYQEHYQKEVAKNILKNNK